MEYVKKEDYPIALRAYLNI